MRSWHEMQFLDETLREGRSRSFLSRQPAQSVRVLRLINEISGISNFCVGFAAHGGADLELLHAVLQAIKNGELSEAISLHFFGFYSTAARCQALLDESPDPDRLVLSQVCTASDLIANRLDGAQLVERLGLSETPGELLAANRLHQLLAAQLSQIIAGYREAGAKRIELVIQDAFRADLGNLSSYIDAVIPFGVSWVKLHDTVGCATVASTGKRIAELTERYPNLNFAVHMHNDYGLATANTCAALVAGAAGADVTATGKGNRAGNASLEQTLLAIRDLHGMHMPSLKAARLNELARAVEDYLGLGQDLYAPITGPLVHYDEASTRTDVQADGPTIWKAFGADAVGGSHNIVFGEYSGASQIRSCLQRHAAEIADLRIDIADPATIEFFGRWIEKERVARFETHSLEAERARSLYLGHVTGMYVTETDFIAELVRTGGCLKDPK